MLTAHEIYLALRPTSNGKRRDLVIQPESPDMRLYLRQSNAWKWLDEVGSHRVKMDHGGFVFELHLDRLFAIDRGDPHGSEQRYQFHERMMLEHGVLAERYRGSR